VVSWRTFLGGEEAGGSPPVDFLIAGVQKAGTFSLYRLLERHPEIALSKAKEVHFFDNETIDWSSPPYRQYHRNFPRWRQGRVRGDATPIYIYWPEALERIRAYNPDIKLILLLRDPIERTYSAWCHQRRKGRGTLSFSAAIREGRTRIDDAKGFGNRHFSYVERGFYAAQLARAVEVFSSSNVLVLDSRNLSRDPGALLAQAANFLGVGARPARSMRFMPTSAARSTHPIVSRRRTSGFSPRFSRTTWQSSGRGSTFGSNNGRSRVCSRARSRHGTSHHACSSPALRARTSRRPVTIKRAILRAKRDAVSRNRDQWASLTAPV
jgi:hypothetical protein